jgi:hypothetical protein
LLSNEILACDLHARGKSNGWIGLDSEAQVVGSAGQRC